ncbi:hypothetical protein [Halorussus halobius]|uniref:hypothetical protein n=1 Tax=Halorussus halobius TaxID=1710537 RepID=UPI00143CEE5E|nr:hypothetical protein [Halorussus halobius]
MGGGSHSGSSFLVFVESGKKPVEVDTIEKIDFRLLRITKAVDAEVSKGLFRVSRS